MTDFKFQKQKYKHNPSDGYVGDCFPTCIACLLNISRDDVPHFFEEWDGDIEQQMVNVGNWLKSKGVWLLKIPYGGSGDYKAAITAIGNANPDKEYLLSGSSRNGVNHVVICKNGKIIHDTSTDDAWIVGPCDDGCYWVEFLVPII